MAAKVNLRTEIGRLLLPFLGGGDEMEEVPGFGLRVFGF